MNLAIVHDYLNQYGGGERVVEVLHEIYPASPVFTSIYFPDKLPLTFKNVDVRSSFMQKLPFLDGHFKKYLLLYKNAIESFSFDDFDIILSSSSAFAKGAKAPGRAFHICYCYSPMRFAWEYDSYIEHEGFGKLYKVLLPYVVRYLKRWDLKTANRVHCYIAISNYVARKIERCYGRRAEVIYPPVNISQFQVSSRLDNYYLIVSRLNGYKKIDLAIKAFNKLGLPLLIAGTGPLEYQLKSIASSNVSFLGKVSEEELINLYANSRGFVFPGKEDFGIAPVEAMASGRPVVAYADGGALETVVEGKTGTFFHEQSPESLCAAVRKLETLSLDPNRIRSHAETFDKEIFKAKLKSFIEKKYAEFHSLHQT